MGALTSLLNRLFFTAAFLLLAVAVLDRISNFFGYTILVGYPAGRLLEFSAIMLLFVIALLLRQTRDAMMHKGP